MLKATQNNSFDDTQALLKRAYYNASIWNKPGKSRCIPELHKTFLEIDSSIQVDLPDTSRLAIEIKQRPCTSELAAANKWEDPLPYATGFSTTINSGSMKNKPTLQDFAV